MKVLDRLKMELSNQSYFSDEQYIQFLVENSLTPTDEYNKPTMQKQLLYTVLDILEAVSNDIDIMRSIETEFSNEGSAYKYIADRIQQVKDKIASIPEPEEDYSCFSLMYTRDRIQQLTQMDFQNILWVSHRQLYELSLKKLYEFLDYKGVAFSWQST